MIQHNSGLRNGPKRFIDRLLYLSVVRVKVVRKKPWALSLSLMMSTPLTSPVEEPLTDFRHVGDEVDEEMWVKRFRFVCFNDYIGSLNCR